jgi:hypothetical protein
MVTLEVDPRIVPHMRLVPIIVVILVCICGYISMHLWSYYCAFVVILVCICGHISVHICSKIENLICS